MDITFSCHNCDQQLVVDEAGAGVTVPCPRCGKSLTIPAIPSQTTRLDFPFRYDDVFSAIVSAVPALAEFRLDSQDRVTGRITVKGGVTLLPRKESLTLLVERIDDDNTLVAIESAKKPGSYHGEAHHQAINFDRVMEAVRMHFRKQQLKTTTGSTTPTWIPLAAGASNCIDRILPRARTPQSLGISFSCSQCGQNIVIDRRGGGLHVNCPKCQAELTVPRGRPGNVSI